MLIYRNWILSNVEDIVNGWQSEFRAWFEPHKFKPLETYQEQAEHTAQLINYSYRNDLCLGLSGGPDSEYVARLFHKMDIPFLPIIIHFPGNESDAERAFALCDELDITPCDIITSEEEIVDYYVNIIFKQYHNNGVCHTFQMMVTDKAKELGLVAVLAETLLFVKPQRIILETFKFLPDFRYHDVIPFFYYTPGMAYAEMREVRRTDTAQTFKARVRRTKYRDKFYPQFSDKSSQMFYDCIKTLDPKTLLCEMGTPLDIIKEMEKYVI